MLGNVCMVVQSELDGGLPFPITQVQVNVSSSGSVDVEEKVTTVPLFMVQEGEAVKEATGAPVVFLSSPQPWANRVMSPAVARKPNPLATANAFIFPPF